MKRSLFFRNLFGLNWLEKWHRSDAAKPLGLGEVDTEWNRRIEENPKFIQIA